jgi:hypothetical protein
VGRDAQFHPTPKSNAGRTGVFLEGRTGGAVLDEGAALPTRSIRQTAEAGHRRPFHVRNAIGFADTAQTLSVR